MGDLTGMGDLTAMLGMINNWSLMSTGFGGALENTLDGIIVFAVFKLISSVYGLFIPKNVNLGYDSIFDVDFPPEQPDDQEAIQTIRES